MKNSKLILVISLLILSMPGAAYAHQQITDLIAINTGFFHPFSGADHIVVMLAVGILAVQQGGKAIYKIPIAFIMLMILGAKLSMVNVDKTYIESGIMLSSIILGSIIMLAYKMKTSLMISIVGCFALFHGYAHATEIPNSLNGYQYVAGFVLATSLLHLIGIITSLMLKQINYPKVIPYIGGLFVVIGILPLIR